MLGKGEAAYVLLSWELFAIFKLKWGMVRLVIEPLRFLLLRFKV
jgi:hypothetical protein